MTTSIEDQISAVFDAIVASTPEPGPTPDGSITVGSTSSPPRAPWLTIAAAAVAVAGIAGVTAINLRSGVDSAPAPARSAPVATAAPTPTTVPSPQAPVTERSVALGDGAPTMFPVLDGAPAGLAPTVNVAWAAAGATRTEALIGRPVDGVLDDAVVVTVQSAPFEIHTIGNVAPHDTTVLGQPALIYDDSRPAGTPLFRVTWGTGPYLMASGPSPFELLDVASTDLFHVTATSASDQPPTLTFGRLPTGFEIIATAEAFGGASMNATLSIGPDNDDISVSRHSWLTMMSLSGPLRRTDVGGTPAWTYASTTATPDITWQVDATTFVYLKVNDGDVTQARSIAAALDFVGWGTWVDRYRPDLGDEPVDP